MQVMLVGVSIGVSNIVGLTAPPPLPPHSIPYLYSSYSSLVTTVNIRKLYDMRRR